MEADWKVKLQIGMAVVLALAGVRLYFIYQDRHAAGPAAKPANTYQYTDDDYVVPSKVHAYDVKSLRSELADKPVWVHAGNQLIAYAASAGSKQVEFHHELGLLPPLDQLHVEDVVLANGPASVEYMRASEKGRPQMMLIFKEEGTGREGAVSAGDKDGAEFRIYVNDLFYLEDPHQLYKHWPADVWKAVDGHQALMGMSELQATLALGTRIAGDGGKPNNRTLEFSDGHTSQKISFESGKAVKIEPASHH